MDTEIAEALDAIPSAGLCVVHLGYRTVDYNEKDFDFDDYDADILEAGIGYRW